MSPTLTQQAAELEAQIEARITAALTPEVLSKLGFRGITPQQAREYLRRKVALGLAEWTAQ